MDTLAERIARDGPLNELDAVGWIIRLGKRLEALHAMGVAHGSVSPACVMTSGVPRTSKGVLKDVAHTAGDPAFQSPERLSGASVSQRDDVWALGATLYLALTGGPPFPGQSAAEVAHKVSSGTPAPLAVFDVGDDDLQRILDDLFARDPSQRIATAFALRRELEKWHPDPSVKDLPPLDEEEQALRDDDDDDIRTVMRTSPLDASDPLPPPAIVRDSSDSRSRFAGHAANSGGGMPVAPAARPAPFGGAARPAPAAHPAHRAAAANTASDDDEDDARTMMIREPPEPAPMQRGAPARRPPAGRAPTPAPGVADIARERAEGKPPHVVRTVDLLKHVAATRDPGVARPPVDEDDDDVRTVMRASPLDIADEDSSDGATVMREAPEVPRGFGPAGGMPAPGRQQPAGHPHAAPAPAASAPGRAPPDPRAATVAFPPQGDDPMPTVAFPAGAFGPLPPEPSRPLAGPGADAFPRPAPGGFPAPAGPHAGTMPGGGPGAPSAQGPAPFQGGAPGGPFAGPGGAATNLAAPASPSSGGRGGLLVLLVALLIATAAGTFLFLRYRPF